MHKKIFFGLLILYIVLPLQAQYVVKGKIVDINKEEVPFSTIQLLGTESLSYKANHSRNKHVSFVFYTE